MFTEARRNRGQRQVGMSVLFKDLRQGQYDRNMQSRRTVTKTQTWPLPAM